MTVSAEPKRRGRPSRITEKTKEKAVELYQADLLNVDEIAKVCGFSLPTLYKILREKGVKE